MKTLFFIAMFEQGRAIAGFLPQAETPQNRYAVQQWPSTRSGAETRSESGMTIKLSEKAKIFIFSGIVFLIFALMVQEGYENAGRMVSPCQSEWCKAAISIFFSSGMMSVAFYAGLLGSAIRVAVRIFLKSEKLKQDLKESVFAICVLFAFVLLFIIGGIGALVACK